MEKTIYDENNGFLVYGAANHDMRQLGRALEVFEQSRILLPQNDDPRISEATICGKQSTVLFLLVEGTGHPQAIDIHIAVSLDWNPRVLSRNIFYKALSPLHTLQKDKSLIKPVGKPRLLR